MPAPPPDAVLGALAAVGLPRALPVPTQLAALRALHPTAWRAVVGWALQQGGLTGGALALGVARTTLRAWRARDDVLAAIELPPRGRPSQGKGQGTADRAARAGKRPRGRPRKEREAAGK